MKFIPARVAFWFLLAGILASSAGYAQESPRPSSATTSSASDASRKPSSSNQRVILKVGNVEVTQEEFESGFFNVGKQGDSGEEEGASEKDRRTLGENYASALALSQKAIADHLDSTPEVSRELAMDRIQVLSDAEYASLMTQAKPTAEEISQHYLAHPADYDEVRIRRLFIWKQHEGSQGRGLSPEDARARAATIREALASGTDPKKVANDLNSSNAGLLDPEPLTFPRRELPPQMEKVAFSLNEGEWAVVQDKPESLILVQLVKHGQRKLSEVSSLIEVRLQNEKMQTMLEDLKKKAGIWMDKQYFATEGAPVPGAQTHVSSPPPERQNK